LKADKKVLLDYFFIALGTFMLGFSIITFWQPHNLVTGGISGLAIIIFYYTESAAGFAVTIPVWLTNLVLNLPLFILGYRLIPREYLVRSVFGYVMLTTSLYVFQFVPSFPSDLLTSAVFGGVIAGVGIGFVFRARATTGGTTLIATILHKWAFKHISTAKILFVVDGVIIIGGLVMFGTISTMYAIIVIFVVTKVTDATIEGLSFAKAAFIISKESDAIAENIATKLDRGVTEMPSRGHFSKQDQTMLLCVVSSKEIVTLKELVYDIDPSAFVIVTDVREVLGEGFKAAKDV